MSNDTESLIFKARIAEQAECFEEMIDSMRKAILLNLNQSDELRDLVSIAYKNYVSPKRTSWRIVSSLETKTKNNEPWKLEQMKSLKETIEKTIAWRL